MTSNRLQHWAIILIAYNFEIKYRSTTAHGNAGALSRLPISSDVTFDKEEACYNGLLSLSVAYKIAPNVVDGIPESLNINTAPFVKIGNGYYYVESNLQRNWYDAYESCRKINADLVAFETMEEWDLINQYLFQMKIDNVYWTGGNDLANVGRHNWFSTGEPVALNIWYPGEPNNYKGIEHCDELGHGRTIHTLNDRNCATKNRYICEAPQPKTASFIVW